jgi:CubicO group peptidase (beta-lactamase class C family)
MIRKAFAKLITATLIVGAAFSTPLEARAGPFPRSAEIQAMLDGRVAGRQNVGIVLVTYRAGHRPRVFTAGTSGRAVLALNGDTLFEIGSITKTFTASLLADMVRRGEVRLDDPVATYLPTSLWVPERRGRKITLLDLATHTSGLPGLPANIHPKDVSNPYADYTDQMLEQFLSSYSLPRDIGSKYEYSAVGIAILGRALGERLNMTWEQALTTRILNPLGMNSTRATLIPALERRLAPGHDETGKRVSNWDIPALPAMGALHSSANDMSKFLIANLTPSSEPFGSAFAKAHVPRVSMDEETRVGLAWQTGHGTNRAIIWHGGGTGGYRSLVAFDPAKQMGVIVLTNFANGADDIGFHLLDPALPLQ